MEVGNVNSKHFVLALKVKSVLDPCEDENDDMEEAGGSLGVDSAQGDDSSDSDSEVNHSQEDQFRVVPVDKQPPEEDNDMVDEDDTQDPLEDEQQYSKVKDWISSRHLDTVELTDILSNFPDISVVLTEEIVDKLVKEGVLTKTGTDSYTKNRQKTSEYEFTEVKEEMDGQALGNKVPQVDDHLYMKALSHALPMKYVTIASLQKNLDGEASQSAVRKLIDRMTRDGYLEAKSNRRLGKRVIHSNLTKEKLMEVKKALHSDVMDIDTNEPQLNANQSEFQEKGNGQRDASTCGVLHSVGSDLTRMRIRSDINLNGSVRSDQTISKNRDHGNTPTSRVVPVDSRESFAARNEDSRANGNPNCCDEAETVYCRSSQDKRSRKTSTVKEPIIQYTKRQKSQAI